MYLSIKNMFVFGLLLLALLGTLLNGQEARAQSQGTVVPYEGVPGARVSPFRILVNGQVVFVEQYKDVHVVRFAFSGPVNIVLMAPTTIGDFSLSPRSYAIPVMHSGHVLFFSLQQPLHVILTVDQEKVIFLTDALETSAPRIGDTNVVNAREYVTDASGTTLQTTALQRALDIAATRVNGILYLPAGRYLSGALRIPKNVSLYLSAGALLLGTGNIADYPDQHFLLFDQASNSRLYGRGVIDTQGKQLRDQAGDRGRVKIIRIRASTGVQIQDIWLRDAGSWTVHILSSQAIAVTNIKIINDMTNTNGDGIDPDGSSQVFIDKGLVYTSDDCVAVKTSGSYGMRTPAQHIWVRNIVCYTKKSALKIGTETKMPISSVYFIQNHIIHADRALALYMEDGSTIDHITFQQNTSEQIGGDNRQSLIDIRISNTDHTGLITNIVISQYTAYQWSPNPSTIYGRPGSPINILFQNLLIAGQPRTQSNDARIETKNAQLTFQFNYPPLSPRFIEGEKYRPASARRSPQSPPR